MIYKYFKLKNDEVGQIAELEIKYGAIGTFLGFLVALIGSFFLKKNKGVQ